MNLDIFKNGEDAWYNGKGFIHNPYNICEEEDNFISWSDGWWSVQNRAEMKDKDQSQREYEIEMEKELKEKEIKRKSKTKRSRAELAGQSTLF